MGMPDTAKRLHKETNQDLVDDEVEAVENYDKAIEESDSPEDIATYEHIKGEEEEHIEELRDLDKMKADEITSEQAWQDFKSGYADFKEKHIKSVKKDRDGDQASLEEKIDVMNAKLSELSTDVAIISDSVPQALGTIEEGKTLEDEAEQEEEENVLEDGAEEEGEGLFDDDDGLDEFFADDGGDDEEEVSEDGEEIFDEGEEDIAEADADGEPIDEGEEVVEEDAPDDTPEDEGADEEVAEEETSEDDDYIPMEDLMGDDEEAPDEEAPNEEEDKDKIMEKMVRVLEKMDRRIAHLERENIGLKKMLSQQNTVQTEPRSMAKSRPRPNTNLKMVKGSYNRPPVSTQYVANQRDIGIGKKKESPENTSVFHRELNEVFEDCERIANQNHF